MSDKAEGPVANAGQTVQQGINQATDAKEQLVEFIRENPIPSAVMAVCIGYILGKIT
jgi:hypothetical protein